MAVMPELFRGGLCLEFGKTLIDSIDIRICFVSTALIVSFVTVRKSRDRISADHQMGDGLITADKCFMQISFAAALSYELNNRHDYTQVRKYCSFLSARDERYLVINDRLTFRGCKNYCGNKTRNLLPTPCRLSISICPWCKRIM